MQECKDCQRWKECVGKRHYNYFDIRWCPYQVLWILEHAGILSDGEWPSDPDSSSAIDPNIQASPGHEAFFVKPELIIGEVDKRMKTTGEAGESLIDAAERGYQLGKDGDRGDLSPPAYNALMYVKGFRRKKVTYSEWKALKKSYQSILKRESGLTTRLE